MKKYCKDCKFFKGLYSTYRYNCVVVDKNKKGPLGFYEEIYQFGSQCNSNFNCEYYQKKWYKFWIKDKK
jgi:hypothetical protein